MYSRWGILWDVLGVGPREGQGAGHPLSHTPPYALSPLTPHLVSSLWLLACNRTLPTAMMSCSDKLMEAEKGVPGTSDFQLTDKKHRHLDW